MQIEAAISLMVNAQIKYFHNIDQNAAKRNILIETLHVFIKNNVIDFFKIPHTGDTNSLDRYG